MKPNVLMILAKVKFLKLTKKVVVYFTLPNQIILQVYYFYYFCF